MIIENKFKMNKVDLKLENTDVGFTASCNYTQIFQVFVNLLSNAVDALVEHKEEADRWVKIEFAPGEDSNKILVTDSGSGIPADIAESIFESFFTTKEIGKGSGLGLSLCKKIMKEHKGDITIDGSCKNTRFILDFPKA